MINEEIVPYLHEHVKQQQRRALRRLWWKQDGAPAHRRIIVKERLAKTDGALQPRGLLDLIMNQRDHQGSLTQLLNVILFSLGESQRELFKTPPRHARDCSSKKPP